MQHRSHTSIAEDCQAVAGVEQYRLMPTLPLYIPPKGSPDAWHQVTAPGGYEWWYFDAEDAATGIRIVAIFFQGFVFHAEYLRRYFRFERRPTNHAPPLPAEYPCAYFVIHEKGKILSQFLTQYRPDQFEAADDTPRVRIGPNEMQLTDDGSYTLAIRGVPWHLTWQGPKRSAGGMLVGDFTFRPAFSHAPAERTFLSRRMTGVDHRRVIAAPYCHVEGTVRIEQADAEPRTITFNGRGYHDHNYGTGPLGPGLKRWIWGRMIFDDRVITFHYAIPRDRSLAPEIHVVEATDREVVEWKDQPIIATWNRGTKVGLTYPGQLHIGEKLKLDHPKLVDVSPFYLRLTYEATIDGHKATAFCEVAYPHRLRWPVLGRMIEMSIGQDEA